MRHFLKNRAWGLGAFFIGFFAFHATATTYYVDINSPNPTPPYTSWATASTNIQSAVNQTINGDFVLVNPGIYYSGGYVAPDGTLSAVVVTNAIIMQSMNGASATFINGSNAMRGIYMQNNSLLTGFTITNGSAGNNSGGGIYCQSQAATVSNCVIIGNITFGAEQLGGKGGPGGGGVFGGNLYNCLVISNSAPEGYGGGDMFSSASDCIIAGNTANFGGGVYQSAIYNCTIADNTAISQGGGVYDANATQSIFENSIIYDNTCTNGANWYGGTYNYCCTIPSGGTANITNAPLFVTEAAGDFHLQSNSPCVNAGYNSYAGTTGDFDGNPRIVGGTIDLGAYEYQGFPLTASIQVGNTNVLAGSSLQLQAVIGDAAANNIIWSFGDGSTATNLMSVWHSWSSPGNYTVTLVVSNSSISTSAIAGLGINVVTQLMSYVNINGNNPIAPYSSWNTAATNIQDAVNAALTGATILVTNGVYQSSGYIAPDGEISAVVANKFVTLQSVNGAAFTSINGNDAMRGIYLGSSSGLFGFTITNCLSTNNNGGGICCGSDAQIVSNCVVVGNTSDGVSQYGQGGQGAGGVFAGTLYNCLIISNSAPNGNGGGDVFSVLNNCVIAGNEGAYGGGVYFSTLNNCTLVNNSASQVGGGAYAPTAVNSILYYNSCSFGANWYNTIYLQGSYNYCCTTPLPAGTSNITAVPLFINSTNNFQLASNSPCINAGDNADVDTTIDLNENPRIIAGTVDMGAYEYYAAQPGIVSIDVDNTNVAVGFPLQLQAIIENGVTTSSSWNFGDGTIVNNQLSASHTWASPGTYIVTFTASLVATNNFVLTNVITNATINLTISVASQPITYVNANGINPVAPYSSWSTAATNIQDAVHAASDGGTVLVTNGTYLSSGYPAPDGILAAVVVTNTLSLQAVNGAATTLINGNSSMRGIYLQDGCALVNFTVTNGYAADGAGIYCQDGNVTISNCVIAGNFATNGLGGGGDIQGRLYNCLLISNSAPNNGGAGGGALDATLNNCVIADNEADAGGAVYQSSMYNCWVTNNSAYQGGASMSYNNGVSIYNCLIADNVATLGGAIFDCTVVNCTVADNTAFSEGGGGYNMTAVNSIVYGNVCPNGANSYSSTFSYSCTTPSPGGTGNITNAPLFVNEASGDYQLQPNSLCINNGNNGNAPGTNDLAGNPRIVGGIVDMGAFEYPNPIPMTVVIGVDNTNVATGFPLQFQAIAGQGVPTMISWNFGDGTMAMNLSPVSHSWPSPGVYIVTVTVSNNFVPQATTVSIAINVVTQPINYVNVNGTNPVPPYTSWSTAAIDIQQAVNAAVYDGEIVMVTNGVYQTNADTIGSTCVTIDKPVAVESVNGPGATIIQGVSGSKNNFSCVYITNSAALIGFTLTNGEASGNGGGVYCQSASCVMSNCVMIGNTANGNGGGVYQGTLFNCALVNNTAWQGFETVGGGGVYQATLINCTILDNFAYYYGGGAANCLIYQSLIVSNMAYYYGGGGTYDCTNSSSALANNNTEAYGGGAYGGILVNCDVTENSAYNGGGGTYNCISTNCIIYSNQIFQNNSSETNVYGGQCYYCCTTPNQGIRCVTSNPQLASISHLSLNSPCIGAGNPAATNGVDIDGNPWNRPPSIGCSELYSTNNIGNLTASISVPFTNWGPGFPLNFQANITGPVYSSVWNFGDGTLATNQPYTSHAWLAPGSYPVTLTAYNDTYPTGVVATQTMIIVMPMVYYVSVNSQNPTPPYSDWSIAATNIQNAISIAPAGSLVLVQHPTNMVLYGGRYTYTTNLPTIYQWSGSGMQGPGGYSYSVAITNPITVQSVSGPYNTWIEPPSGGGNGGACVYLTNGVILNGFTITNRQISPYALGVFCASTNAVITNCIITHLRAGGVSSGTLYNCLITGNAGGAGGSTMFNCVITNNSAYYGGGVEGGILNNCLIVSNTATYGGGVFSSSNYPAVLNNCLISNNTALYGGGIYNSNSFTNCILSNCTITGNAANPSEGYGGGTFNAELNNCLVNSNSAEYGGGVSGGLINNCAIANNSAGGGGGVFGGTLTGFPVVTTLAVLNNCLISNNFAANGGGAFGTPSFTNCTLNNCVIAGNTGNRGGGVYDSWVKNCVVSSNAANEYEGGGADYSVLINCAVTTNSSPGNGGGASYSTLTNCLLAVNQALNGGAAYECLLVDCTVVSNSSPACGGTEASTNYDCLIYDNLVRPSVLTPNYNGGVFAYCDTTPLPPGTRNISVDPQLVNLGGANYQLQPNSPCINSGNNAYINTPTDLAGNPRIVGGTVDIGAYEYQTPTSVISYAWLQQYGLPNDGSVDFADLDGTGFNVYQDWAAGLNPTNSASILAMLTPTNTINTNGITVTWQSVSGIPYLLQRSTNLPGFVTIQSNLIGQTNITSYADTSATNNFPYLYRVGVTVP